jgi:plasmid maintenance system antidote protein VapI
MRLARNFGGDARSWLNLRTAYDLRIAEISNARRILPEASPVTETPLAKPFRVN